MSKTYFYFKAAEGNVLLCQKTATNRYEVINGGWTFRLDPETKAAYMPHKRDPFTKGLELLWQGHWPKGAENSNEAIIDIQETIKSVTPPPRTPMTTTIEQQQAVVNNLSTAIMQLQACSADHQKLTHSEHPDEFYTEALNFLESLMTGEQAVLVRMKALR